ncbi:MAG: universal stress protein [Alphaproteobacteria bacterium]|nr:universal stress protein [Alphaproteobacteria bacterium]
MAIKVILTPLFGVSSDGAALATAQAVAQKFSAHIDVMHIRADPRTMIPYIGEGMSGALIEEMIASAEQQADERAKRVRQSFDDWRAKSGLAMGVSAADGPNCAWIEDTGRPDVCIARRGRVADVVVIARAEGDNAVTTITETLEAALMDSGSPLLVAPSGAPKSVGGHVAIAWNGGLEAARAVTAAMPFLKAAGKATILVVGDPCPPEANAEALAGYLASHGVEAKINAMDAGGDSMSATLLGAAGQAGADLMVMGAYTHSRLRELVFGGVTYEVLAAADIPVLMAH